MKLTICKGVLLIACVAALFIIIMFLRLFTPKKPCYLSDYGDVLPSAEDPRFSPKAQSIFFHETSCRGGLNPRQACTIEAAARAHPQCQVYVLFSAPVTHRTLKTSCLAELIKFHNVNFARVHMIEYTKGTPVDFIFRDKLDISKHPVHHAADILRMVTLNKWGGIYLDMDMIVTRSLESLPQNFIAKENDYEDIAIGVMSFAKDDVGTNISSRIVKEISESFDSNSFNYNGAPAVKRVVKAMCPNLDIVADNNLKPYDCVGLSIFHPDLFYPYYFPDIYDIYKDPVRNGIDLDGPFTYHMWNHALHSEAVKKNSTYDLIAKKFCPSIYAAYSEEFELPQEQA